MDSTEEKTPEPILLKGYIIERIKRITELQRVFNTASPIPEISLLPYLPEYVADEKIAYLIWAILLQTQGKGDDDKLYEALEIVQKALIRKPFSQPLHKTEEKIIGLNNDNSRIQGTHKIQNLPRSPKNKLSTEQQVIANNQVYGATSNRINTLGLTDEEAHVMRTGGIPNHPLAYDKEQFPGFKDTQDPTKTEE